MYVLVFFILANFWKRNGPFGFLLVEFDCGAVALSASFFPFGVLDGTCQDSGYAFGIKKQKQTKLFYSYTSVLNILTIDLLEMSSHTGLYG